MRSEKMLKELFEEVDLDGHVIEVAVSVVLQPLNIIGPEYYLYYIGNSFFLFSWALMMI